MLMICTSNRDQRDSEIITVPNAEIKKYTFIHIWKTRDFSIMLIKIIPRHSSNILFSILSDSMLQ